MSDVVILLSTFDQVVINVHFHTFPDQIPKYVVNQALAGCPYVLETERHHLVVVGSLVDNEGCLLFITGVHTDLIITEISVHERKE